MYVCGLVLWKEELLYNVCYSRSVSPVIEWWFNIYDSWQHMCESKQTDAYSIGLNWQHNMSESKQTNAYSIGSTTSIFKGELHAYMYFVLFCFLHRLYVLANASAARWTCKYSPCVVLVHMHGGIPIVLWLASSSPKWIAGYTGLISNPAGPRGSYSCEIRYHHSLICILSGWE